MLALCSQMSQQFGDVDAWHTGPALQRLLAGMFNVKQSCAAQELTTRVLPRVAQLVRNKIFAWG